MTEFSRKPAVWALLLMLMMNGWSSRCDGAGQASETQPDSPQASPTVTTQEAPPATASGPPVPDAASISDQDQSAAASAESQPKSSPQAVQEIEAEKVDALTQEQLETESLAVQEQIKAAQQAVTAEQAATLGVTEDDLRERVTLLQDLENTLRRRISAQDRMEESRKTIAGLEQQITDFQQLGFDVDPPYEVSLWDRLRDEQATLLLEKETLETSEKTAQALVGQAKQALQAAEQNRRKIRDQLQGTAEEGADRAKLQWQLGIAELKERIAEHELAQAKTQAEIARLALEAHALRVELLEAKLTAVEPQVLLTADELEKQLDELAARKDERDSELRTLRREDEANQVRLRAAREALQQARDENEIRRQTEVLAAREALAQASSQGVELLQERISYLAKVKTLWQRRYALTHDPTEAELAQWQQETRSTLDEIRRRREEAEQRLQTLSQKRVEIENRLSSWDPAMGEKSELQTQLRALENRQGHVRNYLANLFSLERLAQYVSTEIDTRRELKSWRQYWSRLAYLARNSWNHELFVLDDHAIRVGELIRALIVFGLILFSMWVARAIIRRVVRRHLRARADTPNTWLDRSMLSVPRQTKSLFVIVIATYLSLITLPLPPLSRRILDSVAIIAMTTQIAIWADALLGRSIEIIKHRRVQDDPSSASAFGLMGFFSRLGIWSAAILLVLTNLGYEIGPLLAGLGVGGVAVAFALQNILGDIFCSIAIVLDKPFVIGDFIIVNDLLGTVENIGIKTTRIRSLGGEQIVFSNADLISSRVRNYKRLYERRVLFNFGIVYETPLDKLEMIPGMVRGLIEEIQAARFDRAHFKEYGDFALNFEVVYYVLVADYNAYMDIQQTINLKLFQAFAEHRVAFAYPTREIVMRPNAESKVFEQPNADAREVAPADR